MAQTQLFVRPGRARAAALGVGLVLACGGGAGPVQAQDGGTRVVVNGIALTTESVTALQRLYPVAIAPGRYWYDRISGAYGREGEPVQGQMLPGLALGGPLRADASRGHSGVFINGRQLTAGEKAYIEQACNTPVAAGRYFVLAQGLGGFEAGPVSFNLALCAARGATGTGSSTRTFCDPDGSCRSTGILGSILTAPR